MNITKPTSPEFFLSLENNFKPKSSPLYHKLDTDSVTTHCNSNMQNVNCLTKTQ